MGRIIQKIDDDVVRLLAASEVVERPLSVVKELVDNALDAGARTIVIRIVAGGQSSIEVSDDGFGISKDDLADAARQHHSSKTKNMDDVLNPAQRGFRGEALHSISTVADMGITSRQDGDDSAWKVMVSGECVEECKPASGRVGTRVVVGPLFQKVPVRRKLMSTSRHDGNLISDFVRRLAVGLPDVSFTLYKDNTTPIEFRRKPSMDRVRDVFGSDFLDQSTPVDIEFSIGDETWKLDGYIRPQAPGKRASKSRRSLSVGKFLVSEDTVMDHAINRAWASVFSVSNREFEYSLNLKPLESTSFLNFNAHPRKMKVEYYQQARFLDALTSALKGFLSSNNDDIQLLSSVDTSLSAEYDAREDARQPLGQAIGQYRDGYIIAQSDSGMIIVDQHAAHERIILERMLKGVLSSELEIATKKLSNPFLVSDDLVVQDEIMGQEKKLSDIGFKFLTEHHNTFVTHVPKLDGWVPSYDEVIKYFSNDQHEKTTDGLVRVARDLANRACKKAIKSGHRLTLMEMNGFLRLMEKNPESFFCNHGRPTIRKLAHEDILSMFDR